MRLGFSWLPVLSLLGVLLTAASWAQPNPSEPLPAGGNPRTDAGPLPSRSSSPAGEIRGESGGAGSRNADNSTASASPLDTFLLRDSKGNLVPVLGMTFEEFEQLWRAKKGLAAPAVPDYVLDSLSLVGSADEQIARLQLTATIRVRSDDWVRVPLLMPRAVIGQPAKYEGRGEHFLAFDEAAGGYMCWLKGQGAEPHIVTLPVSVGLSRVGEERRLELTLPRATESSLRVTVPETGAIATLHAGDGIVSTRDAAGGRSELSVLGPADDLELAWRAGQRPVAQRAAQLDASGEIVVRIESEHRITSDARLRVRSYGAPLETFQVRLPPDMELVPINLAGYSLTPLLTAAPDATAASEAAAPAGPAEGQVVEVRLERPATGLTEVRLLATLQAGASSAGSRTPARFEILDAVRQRGTIDFIVDGEWQLDWTLDRTARRLEVSPDSTTRAMARFEYFQQPCGLQLKVTARPSRVSVEPVHTVLVDAKQMRVKSALKYRFRGARAAQLIFELGDWQLLGVTPAELFDVPLEASQRTGHVEIAVRDGAALPAELELELEAHRPLPAGAERLSLTFPRPAADLIAPASITIVAANNVELQPLAGELVGLSADVALARNPGPQPAFAYRDLGSGEPVLFAAAIRQRARQTKAAGRATVRIDRQQAQIEQRLEYHVEHEPQATFSLLAPRAALAAGNLDVALAGVPLEFLASADPSGSSASLTRIEFTPPRQQIGTFQVAIRYTLPLVGWDGQKTVALQIPIAVPVADGDYQFTGQEIEFTLAEGMQIEPDMDGVEQQVPAQLAGELQPAFSWTQSEPLTAWFLAPSEAAPAVTATVERLWVQTWLAPTMRQERAVFQVSSPLENLRIRLPKGVVPSSVQAAVDGVEAAKAYRDPGHVIVNLPVAIRGKACVLELFYSLDPPPARLGLVTGELQPAQIDGAAPPRRSYWQLALPENEHLALAPGALSAEMIWSNDRWLATRRPALDSEQLQRWIGASRQDPLPRGANLYLFGGLGTSPTLKLVAAQRRLIVAAASGLILLAGLLLVHVPRLRSPTALLVAAVLLAALAGVAPELALLAGQGTLLGLAIAAAMAVWTGVRSGRVVAVPAPASTIAARPRESAISQPPLVARPDRSSQLTATAPAAAIEVRP